MKLFAIFQSHPPSSIFSMLRIWSNGVALIHHFEMPYALRFPENLTVESEHNPAATMPCVGKLFERSIVMCPD
jgi:hypothetical protein